jgi:hypothetical protein
VLDQSKVHLPITQLRGRTSNVVSAQPSSRLLCRDYRRPCCRHWISRLPRLYVLYNSQQQAADTPTEQSAVAEGVQVAPVVESSSDLDTALTALEATDTSSSSDTAELETGLSAF